MGRIKSELDVQGRKCWTLFDSGARYSYILRNATAGLDVQHLPVPRATALGGRSHQIKDVCLVFARVDGHDVEFQANVVDEVGHDEEGRSIEIVFGAVAMQLWSIKLDLRNERLDLSHITSDFVEF